MAKKIYGLEFIYSDKQNNIKVYSIENINVEKKDEIIQKTCQELIYENEAISIVVKESCIYKVL